MLNFLNLDPALELPINLLFLAITGAIAWHGLHARNEEGKSDVVHLIFGCIAAFYFFAVLFQDVLGLVQLS